MQSSPDVKSDRTCWQGANSSTHPPATAHAARFYIGRIMQASEPLQQQWMYYNTAAFPAFAMHASGRRRSNSGHAWQPRKTTAAVVYWTCFPLSFQALTELRHHDAAMMPQFALPTARTAQWRRQMCRYENSGRCGRLQM